MRYTRDRAGIAGYLTGDGDLRRELRRRAQLGLDYAVPRAPRRTGELQDTARLEFVARGGIHHDRMEYQVVFPSDHAAAVVFGNRRSRAQDFLRGAITVMERG